MDIVSQQFLMGAGGGSKTTYWIATLAFSPQDEEASPSGWQNIRVDAADNVYISAYASPKPSLSKFSDAGVVAWTSTRTTDGSAWNFGASYGQVVLCADGSLVTSGNLIDNNAGRNAGLMNFNSSGTLQAQKNIYGSTFGSGAIIQSTQQLPDGNLITAPIGGYGTAVIINQALSSIVATRYNYKVSSTASYCFISNRSGATYQPIKVYQGSAWLFDSQITIGSDNVMALINLGTDGAATGTSYIYKQTGYSADYFISSRNFAVTSSGVYMVYNSGMFNTTTAFLFSYSSFASGVQFTKMLSGVGLNNISVEVDAQGNAYLAWATAGNVVNIFKYSTNGTIVWKRKITRNTGGDLLDFGGMVVTSKALYIYMKYTVAKLPLDGTLTGTYGQYTWAASTDTDDNSYTLLQTTGSPSSSTTTNPSISTASTPSTTFTLSLTRNVLP